MTTRLATDVDRPLCQRWSDCGRITGDFQSILPPLGIVAEDDTGPLCMVWGYLSAEPGEPWPCPHVPVCFVEFATERPGLPWAVRRQAMCLALDHLGVAAKSLGYGVLFAYALRGSSRILRQFGWEETDPRPKFPMMKRL